MISTRIELLTRMAWRNLWRHKRRTIIMLVAFIVGVWFMLFVAAMTRGLVDSQLRDTIYNMLGHIQIHHPGFLDDPAIEHSMRKPDDALKAALAHNDIKQWAPRVRLPAVIKSEHYWRGVTLVGIDPAREKGLSFIGEPLDGGRMLDGTDDTGIIIGNRMAKKLDTRLGRRIVISTQDAHGEVADRGFRIVGIYRTPLASNELLFVFTGIKTAQSMLKMEDRISEISIAASARDKVAKPVTSLRTAAPRYETKSWIDLEPVLVSMADMYDVILFVWYLIIFLAMSFGLVNTLLMAVFERTREIGLFQALGMKPGLILGQILIESLMLLVVGLALGNLTIWLTMFAIGEGIDMSVIAQGAEAFNMPPMLYFKLALGDIVNANMLVMILGLVASLYPAWRATRAVPVEAITRT